MRTALDSRHELELHTLTYDGRTLVADVVELIVGKGGLVTPGPVSYSITFPKPVAHAVTEEFPAVYSNWVQGEETGFLRRIENTSLRSAMGLDIEQFERQIGYALITAHEILVVYCEGEPSVIDQRG